MRGTNGLPSPRSQNYPDLTNQSQKETPCFSTESLTSQETLSLEQTGLMAHPSWARADCPQQHGGRADCTSWTAPSQEEGERKAWAMVPNFLFQTHQSN